MNETRRFGALSSSVDPTQLAMTVQGVIKLLAGALVFVGVISSTDADSIITQIAVIVPLAVSVYGLAQTVEGIIRKIVVKYAKR